MARSVSSLSRNHTSEVEGEADIQDSSTDAFDPYATLAPQYQTAIQLRTRLRNSSCSNVESGLTRCCFWGLFPN